jgi:hypothetical protein
MKYKELYREWIDESGGLNAAIKRSYDDYTSAKKIITTQPVNQPFLKRGSLYQFKYMDIKLINAMSTTDSVPFFDGKPFILALEHDKQYQYGLNLNVLPMESRILLFQFLYDFFWNDIQFNIGTEYAKWREFKRVDGKTVMRVAKMKSDIAINKYDVSLLRGVSAIEWESAVPASTLYMRHNVIFNKKKNLNMPTLWKLVF